MQVQTVAQRYLDEHMRCYKLFVAKALLAAKRGDARDAKAGPKLFAS